MEKKFQFNSIKTKVISFYNNKYHRLIDMTPNEAIKLLIKMKLKELIILK